MTRRFSPGELSFSRNRVLIDGVIENLNGFPRQKTNSKTPFACPMFGGFDTSINSVHNLARCFSCRQNFNPVEFVMHQLKISFVDSVKWIKSRMPSKAHHQNTSNTPNNKCNNAHSTALGDILADMMPALSESKPDSHSLELIFQRFSRLEHQLSHLYRIVNELQSSLNK